MRYHLYLCAGSLLAVCFLPLLVEANPPVISNFSISEGAPQLSISSDLGVTNSIETTTSFAQDSWVVLTNLLVSQSPYLFRDSLSSSARVRFYRVVMPTSSLAPPNMVLIPSGDFEMGDAFNEGEAYEIPVHTVGVSAFYLEKYEMTKGLWDLVANWSAAHGYTYENVGGGKGTNHPVQSINWYDIVKWCNARSEMEGRTPSYYADAGLTQVYRTGRLEPYVNWHAGYRLPTEAEWEKAARGGASGHRFPWSDVDTIDHSRANYFSDASFPYDVSPTRGFNPAFNDGVWPYTAPVGSFPPNAYGLYDIAGNIWEWCWDYPANYTTDYQLDPRGAASGSTRVGKGGNWDYYAAHCRDAYRYGNPPDHVATNVGFRCALSAP